MTDFKWAYEDLEEGRTIEFEPKIVTAEEIIEFASEFDAQPMHLDEEAGKNSILGGLAASGWHTCAMFMRMMCDAFLLDSTSQGAPGVEYARWKKPVLAGDTLSGRSTITARRRSRSRPDLGFVTCRHELTNQHGEIVLELENTGMFLLRDPGAAA
ncbi:acyl dehydratase [Mesorhizobium sp. J18]|uniref:MaoC family dehydratase n=1 Tax=Mesorhizobium sp. J18 TaxID=935263 RepID=UPI0011997857|nr:MaoC family dehydratase [Mesorhizobium sp. J18]TWG96831.1 acyl dehydratase [Mesorhizobium sp. J18]